MDEDYSSQPYFHISIVSEMLDLHPQTIRNYERMGLVNPARTDGGVRVFSQKDVNRVKRINSFTNMGVNLAGVEIILKLLDRIDDMEKDMDKEMERMDKEMSDRVKQMREKLNSELMGENQEP